MIAEIYHASTLWKNECMISTVNVLEGNSVRMPDTVTKGSFELTQRFLCPPSNVLQPFFIPRGVFHYLTLVGWSWQFMRSITFNTLAPNSKISKCRRGKCLSQSSWLPADCWYMVLSDEFHFSVWADDHHIRVRTDQVQRFQPAFILQRMFLYTDITVTVSGVTFLRQIVLSHHAYNYNISMTCWRHPVVIHVTLRNRYAILGSFYNSLMTYFIRFACLWTVYWLLLFFWPANKVTRTFTNWAYMIHRRGRFG